MNNIWLFFKSLIQPKSWKFWIVIVVLLIIGFAVFGGDDTSPFQTVEASKESLQQIVNVSGRIQATNAVDLSFETGGKISYIGAKVGDHVAKGRVLMSLSSGDYIAQVQKEKSSVASAETRLNQLISGAKQEDLNVYITSAGNAQILLDQATGKESRDAAQIAFQAGVNAMITFTTLQYDYFNDNSPEALLIAQKKGAALYLMYGANDLGRVESWYFLNLDSGMKSRLAVWVSNPDSESPEIILPALQNMLRAEYSAYDVMISYFNSVSITSTDKTTATTAQSSLLTQISTLSTQLQSITTARNTLKNAQAQLELKKSPASSFDIELARQQLDQARANLAYAQAQYAKRVIVSPISGTATNVTGELGELVSPSQPAVSVMGDAQYEIQVYIPEADIGKVQVGNKANVTIDAYDRDQIWEASVVDIYPAATQIEGVPTYKTTIQFAQQDERIKSGMTADVDIITAERESVLAIPQRAIYRVDSKKYVKVLNQSENSDVSEVEIETGIKGNNGLIEITSGLEAGDKIVTN